MSLTASFNDIPVTVPGSDTFDATTELPEVVSNATAVGNNQSLQSDVSMELHDAQILFGGFNSQIEGTDDSLSGTGNTGLSAALAVAIAGAYGVISPANIQATSNVYDILNASVDSAATAVANNANVELDAATPDDALMIADYPQAAFANVTATSNVSDVSLNNYTNLGALGKPIVSSVATAVGNNLNIKVTSPGP